RVYSVVVLWPELLLRSGASVSALTERRQSCLHLLSHQSAERFLETAHILMRHNANPNTLDDDGLAPLHRASVEMVTVLASYEVTDLNISSRDGDTPLLTAVKDRRELVVLALLRADQQYREQQQERAQQADRHQQQQQTIEGKQPVCRTVSAVSGVADEDDPVAYDAHRNAVRTSSAKSTTSTTSRLTLASAASAVFRVVTTYDESGVMRASSAASVNLHSVHRKPERREQMRHKVSRKEDEKVDRQKPEMHATQSSVKRSDTAQTTELNMNTLCTRPTTVVASSYSGSTNLFGAFRKAENCQRMSQCGQPER
ncbi:hypothetical protein AHF37_06543, partial [Paragonimus kellicotti]